MRGLSIPEASEDFTADPVELFFDLAFVFAFSQLVAHLVHHPTWTGAWEAALLFAILWLPWSWFTWAANAVPGNQRAVRAIFLVATAVTVPMAASVGTAFGSGGATFALSGAAILLMSIALQLLALDSESELYRSAMKLATPVFLAIALLVVGGFVDGNARVALWLAMVVITILGTWSAGSSEWIVRTGHFAERHGLILIIALGEVIVAIGIAVVAGFDEGGLTGVTRFALFAAGAFAGLLWWSYFDRVLPALEHKGEHTDASDRGRYARDVYTWAHAPIIAGVITMAAAVEEILLHPSDPLHVEFRWMFAIGVGFYFGGIAITVYRAWRALAFERLTALAVIVVLMMVSGSWEGVWLLVAVNLALLGALVSENFRVESARR
ncbi:MAG: low temperature requirement protein A, partial [Acidimicrobiales bacterium]